VLEDHRKVAIANGVDGAAAFLQQTPELRSFAKWPSRQIIRECPAHMPPYHCGAGLHPDPGKRDDTARLGFKRDAEAT
jgi:hypothetical protein